MTLIKNIKGFCSRTGLKRVPVLVHFTSDNLGETLSLESQGTQITVNFADVLKIVEKERAKGYKDGHDITYEPDEPEDWQA